MGKKRGVLFWALVIVVVACWLVPFSSATVDVVSNGKDWYYCSATTDPIPSGLVDAIPVLNFYQLNTSPSIQLGPREYYRLECSDGSLTGPFSDVTLVSHHTGWNDWDEAQLLPRDQQEGCLFNNLLPSSSILPGSWKWITHQVSSVQTNCTICDSDAVLPARTVTTPPPFPPPSGDSFLDKGSCTNAQSAACLGENQVPETPLSCGQGTDADKDGKIGCADPDCSFCDGTPTTGCINGTKAPGVNDYLSCVHKTEICNNGIDDDGNGLVDCQDPACVRFWNESYRCTDPLYQSGVPSAAAKLPNSFICYAQDGNDIFSECCAEGICQNAPSKSPFIVDNSRLSLLGKPLYTLYTGGDLFTTISSNNVLQDKVRRTVLTSCQFGFGPIAENRPIDWQAISADYIEIDFMFSNPDAVENFTITQDSVPAAKYKNIQKYSLNGWAPYRWHHLKFPLHPSGDSDASVTLDLSNMNNILFSFSGGGTSCPAIATPRPNVATVALDVVSLTSDSQPKYYCSGPYKEWIRSLDPTQYENMTGGTFAQIAASGNTDYLSRIYREYQKVCDANPSYGWTGSECCGINSSQYWADSNYGGCWNSFFIGNGDRANDTLNQQMASDGNSNAFLSRVLYDTDTVNLLNGKYYVCGYGSISSSAQRRVTFNADFGGTDKVPSSSSVIFANDCAIKENYFCNPDVGWTNESVLDQVGPKGTTIPATLRTNLSSNQTNDGSSCCPQDHCFNGTTCVLGTSAFIGSNTNPDFATLFPNKNTHDLTIANVQKVCTIINGVAAWQLVYKKFDWNNDPDNYGYCQANSQCWDGTANACVTSGNFTQDHYCANVNGVGAWTTRTALVAKALFVNFTKGNDFTLFCDDTPSTVLNSVTTPAISSTLFNGFCSLRFNDGTSDKVVIGTSLNGDVQTAVSSILGARSGVSGANPASPRIVDTYLQRICLFQNTTPVGPYPHYASLGWCNDNFYYHNVSFYYDNTTKLFFFAESKENLMSTPIPSVFDSFTNWLNGLLGSGESSSVTNSLATINEVLNQTRYNRLYFQKKGDVLISAYQDMLPQPITQSGTGSDTAFIIEYKNLATNMQPAYDSLPETASSPGLANTFIPGTLTNGRYDAQRIYFLNQGDSIDTYWIQLTAGMRLQSPYQQPPSCEALGTQPGCLNPNQARALYGTSLTGIHAIDNPCSNSGATCYACSLSYVWNAVQGLCIPKSVS